jgi:hypothetical protein
VEAGSGTFPVAGGCAPHAHADERTVPRQFGSSRIVGELMSRSASAAPFAAGAYTTVSGSVWPGWVCLVCGLQGPDADVIDRLAAAMNAPDLDAAAGLFHEDYRSDQPAHPGRAFADEPRCAPTGRPCSRGVPDFHAEICRSVHDGET